MSLYQHVPTRFVWRFGGRQVHLCGSFTRWVETVPMAPVEGSPGVFAVVVHLPPGYHQYKFIVDGKWRHDETAPFMQDPLGNVNNWLFVRKIEPAQQPYPGLLSLDAQVSAPAGIQPPAIQAPPQQLIPAPQTTNVPAVAVAHTGSLAQPNPSDVDMSSADPVVAPILIHNPKEPDYTLKKVHDFLVSHTAYELVPESGMTVVLDMDLPIRQAFHALHQQGTASAPLWDSTTASVAGMISASDFIQVLKQLRTSVSSGVINPMNEVEMDAHTIRGLREQANLEGSPPKPLVYVKPNDHLELVVRTMFHNKCSMAPILSADPGGREVSNVLHTATLSGVLSCIMRHFRASLASLPLLSQPLHSLPLGTWAEDSLAGLQEPVSMDEHERHQRKTGRIHTVLPTTPLITALTMLLENGVSALCVVDENRCLLDVYARADITQLCKANAYNRLQWEDVTVGQALSLSHVGGTLHWNQPGIGPLGSEGHPGMEGQVHGIRGGAHAALAASAQQSKRVALVTRDDTLRTVVEWLAVPGVRRVVVVTPDTKRVEGVISLSDVAAFLFLSLG